MSNSVFYVAILTACGGGGDGAIALCDVFGISLNVFTGRKEYPNNKPAIRIEPIKNLGQNNNIRSSL